MRTGAQQILTAEVLESLLAEIDEASLAEQWNAPRAAKVLSTHRNRVLERVARAERLRPKPLSRQRFEVAVALELASWSDLSGR
jgi:DNA-binding PucR family transcriptional regulator